MCGFVSIVAKSISPYKGIAERAFRYIQHRGPNDSESMSLSWAWAGFHRLSILDLSNHGQQPMTFKHYHIVHNGEVYNFREIRKELKRLGHQFQSDTDTEVVLKSYVQWGESCINRFNGMWSFAIFNEINRTVSIFRDRLGVKPLYYTHRSGEFFAFASEIKALHPFVQFKEERENVHEYLMYKSLLGNETLISNIFSLSPGESLVFDIDKDEIRKKMYYKQPSLFTSNNIEQVVEEVEEILIDAVRLRLISDVDVGLQLSGGVDSSLIAAIIQTHFPRQTLNSYSVSFPGSELDESPFQQIVAKKYGITHHEIPFESNDFSEYLDSSVWYEDYPVVHPSSAAILKLSEYASEEITVLLGGEGADELFCGYPKYTYAANRHLLSLLTKMNPLSGLLIPPIGKLKTLRSWVKGNPDFETLFIKNLRNDNLLDMVSKYEDAGTEKRINWMHNTNAEQAIPLLDQATSLRVLLRRFDRMTMAASIEGRVPFCDYRLMEYANSLPMKLKIQPGNMKVILKKVAEKYLPHELIYRKKMGFSMPVHKWFQKDKKLNDRLEILRDKKFLDKGIVDSSDLLKILDQKKISSHQFNDVVWPLLSYEMWHQAHISDYATGKI